MAILLLAAILIACLFFAGAVIRSKERALALRLDRLFPFSTAAGQFSLKVSSKWSRLDHVSPGMIAAWGVPGPEGTGAGTFIIEVFGFHPTNRNEFFAILNHYNVPLSPSLRIQPVTKGLLSLPNVDLQQLFRNPYEPWILSATLVYLPNGTTLALTFIGPHSGRDDALGWFEQSLRTLKFKSAQPSPAPSPPPMDGPTIQTSLFRRNIIISKRVSRRLLTLHRVACFRASRKHGLCAPGAKTWLREDAKPCHPDGQMTFGCPLRISQSLLLNGTAIWTNPNA